MAKACTTAIGRTNYPAIPLTDLTLRALTPVKVTLAQYDGLDHSRWVFRGRVSGSTDIFYCKIWNPGYVRRDNILAAVESGFYDDRLVPALHALIFHKDLCRGYVMHEGEVRRSAPSDECRHLLSTRTRQTGFFAVQFGIGHTMAYKNKWSLLDLEAVYPIAGFPRLSDYHCRFEDDAYERFVSELYQQFSSAYPTASEKVHEGSVDEPHGLPATLPQGRLTRLSRRMIRRFRNLRPRMDLIEY